MKKIKRFFSKKCCTVSIGVDGVLFIFHCRRRVERTVFVRNLDEAKKSIKEIFRDKSGYKIYIVLNNHDQIYKYKRYPKIKSSDVSRLIKRDLVKEGVKSKNRIIQNFILKKEKVDKRWGALLFWIELKPELQDWIEFLVLLPKNRLVGIYSLPIESKSSLLYITKVVAQDFNINKQSNIDILTLYTTDSGFRQFVFYKNSLILSRDPDQDLENDNFAGDFERDMLRIIQYLKRTFDIEISNINFINILPKKFIKKFDAIHAKSLKIVNYESGVMANKIGVINNKEDKSEIFPDEIIANNFINSKKKFFKFSTGRIKKINIFHTFTSILFFINISIIIFLGYQLFQLFLSNINKVDEVVNLKLEESNLQLEFDKIRKKSLGNADVGGKFYEIIDFGKIDGFFAKREGLYLKILSKTAIISKKNNIVKSLSYSFNNFQHSDSKLKYKLNIAGHIANKNGDIDKLFVNFDNLILPLKKSLKRDRLKYDDIPNNIDFNKKFYKYPFNITIEPK